ncbi:hypothetical protein J2T17_006179 [Paenibacillus mucilaginosus]
MQLEKGSQPHRNASRITRREKPAVSLAEKWIG